MCTIRPERDAEIYFSFKQDYWATTASTAESAFAETSDMKTADSESSVSFCCFRLCAAQRLEENI